MDATCGTNGTFPHPMTPMQTSVECRKIAAAKIAEAERLRDERCANRLISAANAWLILARGLRSLDQEGSSERSPEGDRRQIKEAGN